MAPIPTLPRIQIVRKDAHLAPTSVAHPTTRTEAPSSPDIPALPVRAPSHRLQPNSGKGDPSIVARDEKVAAVKEKFRDVFEVSSHCEEVDRGLLDNFSDQKSVASR